MTTTTSLEDAISEIGAFVRVATSPLELFNYVRRAMKENPGKAIFASVALGVLIAAKVSLYLERRAAVRSRHNGASRHTHSIEMR